ncbi:MAG: 50S ribosomal protein L37e [Candidatus Aenigmarchaeota archaeon]|nr:50S ribosomal protein L37e [Candidatus Aenigmarchaeota archaeon]
MDGKPSFGKRNKLVHMLCRRCGRHAMHITHKACAACGFGNTSRMRTYAWKTKNSIVKKTRK